MPVDKLELADPWQIVLDATEERKAAYSDIVSVIYANVGKMNWPDVAQLAMAMRRLSESDNTLLDLAKIMRAPLPK